MVYFFTHLTRCTGELRRFLIIEPDTDPGAVGELNAAPFELGPDLLESVAAGNPQPFFESEDRLWSDSDLGSKFDLADTEQASRRCHLVTSHLHFLLDSAGDIGKHSIVEISTMQVRG